MEPKIEQQARGTRILVGATAAKRRTIINGLIEVATRRGFTEVYLPSIEPADIYKEKAGDEILRQMYTFQDKKDRLLCLRPEGTATCQLLAKEFYKQESDVKLWYVTTCWRYERPQAGRYREFTQFGCEWLKPKDFGLAREWMIAYAKEMVGTVTGQEFGYEFADSVKRGLAYYTEDGFEISVPTLGAQKQVCGGGAYEEGVGFAIGVDRLMLI
jgi:histidyl-tRNA synthetase